MASSVGKPMTRRQILAGLGVLSLTALAAACAPAAEPTATPAPAAKPTQAPAAPATQPTPAPSAKQAPSQAGEVTVVFWGHNHVPRVNLDKRLLEEFKGKEPNVNVDYVVVPQEYEVKLTAGMAAGEGPDWYNLTSSYNYTFTAKGFAATVDFSTWGLGSQAEFEKLYVKGTLEGFKYQGKLFGVPSEVSNYAPFYNKAHWKEAGLDPEKDFPKTWEEMPGFAEKLTKREGSKLTRRGFDFTYMTQQGRWTSPVYTFTGMAYQLGGDLFSPDGKESLINSDPFVEALQYQHDWINKYKLGSPALLGSNQGFAQGEVSMSMIGYWAFASLKAQYQEVYPQAAVFGFPQYAKAKRKAGALLYGYAWMVNAKSKDPVKEAAWKAIRFVTDHPLDYLKEAGLLQPQTKMTESKEFAELPHIGIFLKDAEGTPYGYPPVPGVIEIGQAVVRAMERVTQESKDPKQSLMQCKQEIDEILKKG